MKTWIKTSLAAALAATVGLGTAGAIAGGGGGCGGARGGMHGMKHRTDPAAMSERADQRLATLREALALRPEQRVAWDKFSGVMRGNAERAGEHMQAMRTAQSPATALERMDHMQTFAEERLAAMQEMRNAAAELYAVLDSGQKNTFDERFRLGGPRGGGDGRWSDRMKRGPEGGPGA